MQLSRQPLCEHCALLGKVEQATEVDHIKRPLGDEVLQRNPENWQSLCGFHHKRKSIWERADRKRALVIGVALDGWRIELPHGCVERDRSLRGVGLQLRELRDQPMGAVAFANAQQF
jgi:hypothetical protein